MTRNQNTARASLLASAVLALLLVPASTAAAALPVPTPTEPVLEHDVSTSIVDDLLEEKPDLDVEIVSPDGQPDPAAGVPGLPALPGGGEATAPTGAGTGSPSNDGSTGTKTSTARGKRAAGSNGTKNVTRPGSDDVAANDQAYGALAVRGSLAVAERALELAGTFAPALGFVVVAFFILTGAARGNRRLVKASDDARPSRVYRL